MSDTDVALPHNVPPARAACLRERPAVAVGERAQDSTGDDHADVYGGGSYAANRAPRAIIDITASGVSSVSPRAPCTWIARSITSQSTPAA